ncbi:hypothetical protein Btru_054216 [Bulinus truncatus]|nr:hypothetical protein Btru_054216 [Bulinus truncatus]
MKLFVIFTAHWAQFWLMSPMLLFAIDVSQKRFILISERTNGTEGETFIFYLWYTDDVIHNNSMENFLINLQYRFLGESKVVYHCLLTEELEERMLPLFVRSRSAIIKYSNVRKFQLKLQSAGYYDVIVAITWGGVNNQQIEMAKSRDMNNVTIKVMPKKKIPVNDCLLRETFTINDQETSEDIKKHFVQVDNSEWIVVKKKRLHEYCNHSKGIKRHWRIERIFNVVHNKNNFPSQCFHPREISQVDISKLASHFTSTPLPFPMNLNAFTIQPFLLPAGFYRICMDLNRTDMKSIAGNLKTEYCGFLTIKQVIIKDVFRINISPAEESFTWPKSDLLIDASKSYYIYELPESGFVDKPTISILHSLNGT